MAHEVSVSVGALEMTFESGRMAKMSSGSCVVQYGDTIVMAALADGKPRGNLGFFPLTMDYREKMYASGLIPGGFFKREGRPTEKEILTMRLMDRPIRPLFPKGFMWDVQVQAMVLSHDMQNDSDILAINAGSAALAISPLPWNGPVGAVRIGRIDDEWVVNPTVAQRAESELDLVVVGTATAISMVEASANEMREDVIVEALEVAHRAIVPICEAQARLVAICGKEKMAFDPPIEDPALLDEIRSKCTADLTTAHTASGDKHTKNAIHKAAIKAIVAEYAPAGDDGEADADRVSLVKRYAEIASREAFRAVVLTGTRYDGRRPDEVRNLESSVGLLPRAHGSALFQRGETQNLTVLALGSKREEQLIEGLHETYWNKFMLHYNFANFCVGEPKFIRGPGRREIGHGKLAERALQCVLPDHDDFPYTIRLVAETMESNGSSSMAAVCGGTLALMDAGVKISQPVAGIAMGLVTDGETEIIMTDIAGKEDAWGDMDFKVAGTQRGITALQMDIKIAGVSSDLMRRALNQARDARIEILRHMLTTLRRPRDELSKYAPQSSRFMINPEKIGAMIGPGGKVIKGLQEEFSCNINVEDDGRVTVSAVDGEMMAMAIEAIKAITAEAEVGRIYEGKVVSIKEFGAFVEIARGMEGLCHVSELDDEYVSNPEDVVNVGDTIKVKCVYVDPTGKVKLSRKAVIREEKGLPVDEYKPPQRGGGRDRGGRGSPRGRR